MSKPINILFWQWLHDRLEFAWHWVWNRKLANYYFPKDSPSSSPVFYSMGIDYGDGSDHSVVAVIDGDGKIVSVEERP